MSEEDWMYRELARRFSEPLDAVSKRLIRKGDLEGLVKHTNSFGYEGRKKSADFQERGLQHTLRV